MNRACTLAVALLLAWAGLASAQIAGGNIYGTAVDQQGGVLPGATVTLTATSIGGQPRATVTDASGQFRFLNLDSGNYRIEIDMPGFTKQTREVIVTTGINTTVNFTLAVGAIEAAVNVTAESPVIDFKKTGTATTLSREELQGTPQSKDPWAMLKTVPGVIVDRVNVGGNESGQQSGFAGKGALFADTMWNLDGVVITDTTSGGASSSYFDFDAFDEVAVNTGGNDLKVQTGGIGINFVTRRGTNQFKGFFKYSYDGDKLESSNLPDALKNDPRLQGADKANHTDRIYDVGFDIGGPILKDKLWFWGSYGRNDIGIVRLTQTGDRTILKNTNAKINWSATSKDEISGFFFNGAKEKLGRSPGQAANEADSFLWNQGNFYPEEGLLHPLHGLWKIEDNHVFGPNLFVNGKYAWYGWGYGFAPRGGTNQDGGINYDTNSAYGSWLTYTARKPWHIVDVSGSAFKATKSTNHEFKFGFGYRRNPNHSTTRWSGSEVVAHVNPAGDGLDYALAYRARVVNYVGENWDAFVGDTITMNRLTLNAGVRWDRQTAANDGSTAPANTMFPDLLPTLTYDGSGPTIKWNNVSPRIGATYAIGESKKTIARASYSLYAGQLNPFEVTSASPVGAYYTYIAYRWNDLNHDGFAQKNEILTNLGPQYSNAIDPKNPTSISSVNTIDSNYHANRDHEFIVGLDHEVMPNMSVGAAFTYRRTNDWPTWNPRIGLTSADYSVVGTPSAGGYTVTAYGPNPAKVEASGGGRILTNRPDYHSTYSGIELNLIKRLSNRWMARVAFSTNSWTEHFDGSAAVQNPTRTDSTTGAVTGALSGPQVDGGQIAPRSGGSGKGDIFYNARWQINANGFYQLPKDFEVGMNLFGRQGYVMPLVIQTSAGLDGRVRALATPALDANRYPNLWDLDLRVSKNIKIQRVGILLSADLFNALNADTVLARSRLLGTSAFGAINEIISPRIMRVGLKVQF
jgi:hypothetical protein